MIKKLRRRVAMYTIIAVAIIFIILMSAINIANYISKDRNSEEMISLLLENGGRFPMQEGMRGDKPPKGNKKPRFFTDETPFETRFFSVTMNADGSVAKVDTGQIAAISTENAEEMAKAIFDTGKEKGYSGSYKYGSGDAGDGKLYVFLDCTRDLESVKTFLRTSLLVTALGLLAIGALVIIFSPLMIRPITESYEKQKRFISDAGHELKTPLAVISSCTEVLELEQGENKWTEGIKDQVERMGQLTHDLISLARMEEAESQIEMEEVNLSQVCKEAIEPFVLLAEQKGLKLDTYIPGGITMKGNAKMLRELVSILGDNAVKYSAGDEIHFFLSHAGKRITIETKNKAEGISPGKQNEFFDRFYRGDSSRTKGATSGYGIGLSMAKSIAQAHGGTMEATSPDGEELIIAARF